MAKMEVDNLIRIKIWDIMKREMQGGFNVKEILEGSNLKEWRICLKYTQTSSDGEQKREFKYKVSVTKTSCNFGGYRYWFLCPFCNKRVGAIYKGGDYFACRHCYVLTYKSSNLSRFERRFGRVLNTLELKDLENAVKIKYRKGKITKKYARFLRESEKHGYSCAIAGMELLYGRGN